MTSLEGIKIVAIDDTPSIRTFLRLSLEDEGAVFYEAADATEGLKLCHNVVPDVVVLDLGLPQIDGLDVLADIKNSQSGDRPAVVVLTVRKARQIIEQAMNKGADAFLNKPFIMDDLLDVISEQVQ